MRMPLRLACVLFLWGCVMTHAVAGSPNLVTYPGPEGEKPSRDYDVRVNGQEVFAYTAKVRQEISKPAGSIWTHEMGAKAELASFAYFDFKGHVTVAVTPKRAFQQATIHPLSCGIKPAIEGRTIRFALDRPRKLTILLDGSDKRPLHLFANALEVDPPKPDEKPRVSKRTGLKHYGGAIWSLERVSGVKIRGRGILDGGDMPHASKTLITLSGASDVEIDGIIVRDSPNWAVCIHSSQGVRVTDMKQISGRLNSDGINSVNSRRVRIRDCFVRSHDDSIVVKTTRPESEASDTEVEECIIWNDWGYALGITYETRAPIHHVTFRNCDVLHVRFAALGIYIVDAATIRDITFDDIRVESTRDKLIRVRIGSDMWGTDSERGHIRDVLFKDIRFSGARLPSSEIAGFDPEHRVENVTLKRLRHRGKPIANAAQGRFAINPHTSKIRFEP